MWKIRILKGPQASATFNLPLGDSIIGRSPSCDIPISSAGLSKEHAKFTVTQDGIYITDMKSTNGTFVNGIRIQTQKLKTNDKIALFDIIIGLEYSQKDFPITTMPSSIPSHQSTYGNLAIKTEPNMMPTPMGHSEIASISSTHQAQSKDLASLAQQYVDNVVMPAVYRLPEIIEFKWLVGLFILVFALVVTSLAVIPMINITQESIQIESQRRALSIARSIVTAYERAVQDGMENSFSSRIVEREPGVQSYYIISSSDGVILAPPSRAGIRPDDPFVHDARKNDQESIKQINTSLIGAAVPIKSLDRETGSIRVISHAVVLYDMGALAVSTDRIISLFVQVLIITLTIGFLVYFFLYKIIELPIRTLNKQIDESLKDGQSMTSSSYLYPELQNLIANINTALNRVQNPQTPSSMSFTDRSMEPMNLLEGLTNPALALGADYKIIGFNNSFSQLVGLAGQNLVQESYENLNDSSLVLNLKDMLEQCQQGGYIRVQSQLEFNSQNMDIHLIPIFDEKGVRYYFISFTTIGGF